MLSRKLMLIAAIVLSAGLLTGQPSGGPYGPQHMSYDVPSDGSRVYFVATDGNEKSSGTDIGKPTTLHSAVARAETGNHIILRGGTYRTGGLVTNQGIVLQPYLDEKPVLKGSLVAKNWENLNNGLWRTQWKHLFPAKPEPWWRRHREGKHTPVSLFNNDMVFIDGRMLKTVGWEGEVDEDSFFIDYDAGYVYIGTNPANRLVEITAQDFAFTWAMGTVNGKRSDRKGPVIRGLTLTQYAYRAFEFEGKDPEGISPRDAHGKDRIGTVLEHCAITYCSRVGGYFRGDGLIIRNCLVSDTSTEGIFVLNSSDVLLERNIIRRNNVENITGYYPAAVKIYNQCYDVICRDNLIIDHPNSSGIWYDVGNVDGVIVNNWFERVGQRSNVYSTDQVGTHRNAFFFEISKGAICAGNVFVECEQGVNIYNSSGVHLFNNTFVNSKACFGRTSRGMNPDHFGWHPTTGPAYDERDDHVFENNLMYANDRFPHPLLSVWQEDGLKIPGGKPQVKQLDNNAYVRNSAGANYSLVLFSPINPDAEGINFRSLKELRQRYPDVEKNSLYLQGNYDSLFRSVELRNFKLTDSFPVNSAAAQISQKLRQSAGMEFPGNYVGAYPPAN